MRVYRDHHHRDLSAASSVAIGNFDGVHRGHQALLRQARELADGHEQGFPADNGDGVTAKPPGTERVSVAVVSFEPLPSAFFNPANAPRRLTGPAEKLRLLRAQGVDLTWLLRFNGALASMSPRAFVEQILVRGLNARSVIIGRDFRFGKAREGDLAMMHALGEELGFVVAPVADVEEQGARVSSTALRRALAEGDFAGAGRMLGRPYTVRGRVVRGQQLGRKLGYPTANIRPWKGSTPLHGVYAVQCRIVKTRAHGLSGDRADAWHDGVASVGVRPAVGGGETLLEVHLFDFNGDLYGDVLETRFVSRLRGEEDFPDMNALVAQMNIDSEGARAALAALNPE